MYARESSTVSSVTKVVSGTKRSASVAEPFRFERMKGIKIGVRSSEENGCRQR